MELLHKGFDAVDLAYPYHLPMELIEKLEATKIRAMEINAPCVVDLKGKKFNVAPTGARGGYAYRCDTGRLGETWFFKKPNRRDPWGIRISVSAIQCALRGLKGVKEHLETTLFKLGVIVFTGAESIARIDFAMDFLFPDFELVSNNFVMNSRFGKMKHASLLEYKEAGTSGRTTSVTVGKNPNRQLIVYDKRAEVLTKRKDHWLEVWNIKRKRDGKPPIALDDPKTSRIWRIELRAYKKHLKEDWHVTNWGHLQKHLPYILRSILNDIRYKVPTRDSNRARWPDHPLWSQAFSELHKEMDNLRSFASEERISEIHRNQKIQIILDQMAGCQIALAGLRNIELKDFYMFVRATSEELSRKMKRDRKRTAEKLERATEKYSL